LEQAAENHAGLVAERPVVDQRPLGMPGRLFADDLADHAVRGGDRRQKILFSCCPLSERMRMAVTLEKIRDPKSSLTSDRLSIRGVARLAFPGLIARQRPVRSLSRT